MSDSSNAFKLNLGDGRIATLHYPTQEELDRNYRRRLLEQIIKAVNENDDLHAALRIALECHP